MEIRISSELLLKILWIVSVVCSVIGFVMSVLGIVWSISADGLDEAMRGVAIVAGGLAMSVVPRSLTSSIVSLLGIAEDED